MMELNRITSHLVCLATGGNELGATTIMTVGFTAREEILKIFELITGLRMNHAYIRPGGVAQDIPPGAIDTIRESLVLVRHYFKQLEDLMMANPILHLRLKDVGYLGLSGLHGAGRHRTGAAVGGPAVRRAQGQPVLRLRDVRLRRPGRADRRTPGGASCCASRSATSR